MVSIFGTSLSSGGGSTDLASYAKKTDLNPVAHVVTDLTVRQEGLTYNVGKLQTKLTEIDREIDTVQKSEGLRGKPGATWHNSFGNPNIKGMGGNPNDFLLDSTTGNVYKRYGNPITWNHFANIKGLKGDQGYGWKNFHDIPTDPPTRRGDFLHHNTTGDIYKSIGWPPRWERFGLFKGPSGEVGPKGEKGEQGLRGEKGNIGSPGSMNVHICRMLYGHIADIVKKGNFYTLTTPDLDYAKINYSQENKVVKGNYASETYDDNPYTSNIPQSGNWNFYAAYEFNAIEADSLLTK